MIDPLAPYFVILLLVALLGLALLLLVIREQEHRRVRSADRSLICSLYAEAAELKEMLRALLPPEPVTITPREAEGRYIGLDLEAQ